MRTPSLSLCILLLCIGCGKTEPMCRDAGEADQQKSEEQTDDMEAYLRKTEQLIREGRSTDYKEALDRCVWFHKHALEHDAAMYGARLSWALTYWKALGDVYPPAKQALLDTRNRNTKQLMEGRGNVALFHDVSAMNSTLGENAKTVRLFREIDKTNGMLAAQCWKAARDAVFMEKQYDIAKKYFKAPLEEYDRVKARYDYDMRQVGTDSEAYGPEFERLTKNDFVEKCVKLIEAATAIGDKSAAQEIRKRAASVVNDQRLRETSTSVN